MPYCDKCDKMFATRQSLWKHCKRKHVDGEEKKRKYPCDGSKTRTTPKSIVPSPEKVDYAENEDVLLDIESPDRDIPTFDGAEFCGDKPLSDDTLLRMMENLGVPPDKRARNLELFRKDQEKDKKVREKMKNSCNFIDTLDSKQDDCPTRQVKSLKAYKDLSEEEKILVEKFSLTIKFYTHCD